MAERLSRGLLTAATILITVLSANGFAADGVAVAAPPTGEPLTADDGTRIHDIRQVSDRVLDVGVHSAAMDTVTRLTVLRAADPDRPAPTFYLLNGANGGSDGNWLETTDLVRFFHDKQVNVVIPFGGAGSYFTDWRTDDPILGRQRWATFLTQELPPIIDNAFRGNGANAIAGLSMAGTSVFQLAIGAPQLYRAIGSYSGCVRTSDPQGQAMVQAVVTGQRGNAVNMWGPPSDPAWAANDPYLHADRLRGTAVYVSTGTGLPGPRDNLQGARGDAMQLMYQLFFGAPLEAITNVCTHQLQERLRQLNVPATFDFRPTGTHSWGYWEEDLHNSWPMFESALARPEKDESPSR
ncbi:S-formylglutathione hydrolase FrmB [Nocardia transvalensis]|uniref:S-formylglutathione hydrolase FrmB n=1 Tax=Nocardia transvalensis TaxID=37333 RepID=A0A7W9PK00_9NOCA|nr:alpha/beta hydrolase family protein [Nocardia transvalensis]MBB5917559.1 S-formylglutathione hydrolase FrmB [Nocardia transvalensis]